MDSECQYLPRETCTPERVRPKETRKPVIKKVCTKSTENEDVIIPDAGEAMPSEKGNQIFGAKIQIVII